MFCSKCGVPNRDEANFCKACGNRLKIASVVPEAKSPFILPRIKTKFITEKINSGLTTLKKFSARSPKKIKIIAAVIVLAAIAAPSAYAYFKYYQATSEAKKLFSAGNYKQAATKLSTINSKGLFSTFKIKLNHTSELYLKVSDTDADFESAKSERDKGNLEKAKELLIKVSNQTNYPKIADALKELNAVTEQISEGKVSGAQKQADAAAAKAEAERSSRQRAEQSASRSAAEAAASQAEADSARRRAAENAAAAEQEAAARDQQLKISFRNEIVDAYNSFNQAWSYYGSAVSYSNSGNSIPALSAAGSARALLTTAYNGISTIRSRYQGTSVPSNYFDAAGSMISAINALNYACDLLIQSEGTSLDLSGTINTNKNSAMNYISQVKYFLDTTNN